MLGIDVWFKDSLENGQSQTLSSIDCSNSNSICFVGGLFLDQPIPSSIIETVSPTNNSINFSNSSTPRRKPAVFRVVGGEFLCLSLSIKRNGELIQSSDEQRNADKIRLQGRRGGMNTTKHLWAGAVAAMVSRTVLAPLERLKLEYIVRGEQKNLFELVTRIAASQGLRGFWKGNLVNILRTAPFKAINFFAFDTYRKKLLRLSGNKETTNVERFIAGAAAGITASVLCLPLDTTSTLS